MMAICLTLSLPITRNIKIIVMARSNTPERWDDERYTIIKRTENATAWSRRLRLDRF